jgi:hypothetical protein
MLWKSPSRARGRDFWIWNYEYDGLRNSLTCQSENARFPIRNWPRIASRDSAQTRRNEQEKITQTHAARSTNYSQLFHKAKSHAFAASKMRISRWFRAFCANCASTPERDQKNAEASVCGNPPRALDKRSLRESPNPFLRAREPIGKPRNSRRGGGIGERIPRPSCAFTASGGTRSPKFRDRKESRPPAFHRDGWPSSRANRRSRLARHWLVAPRNIYEALQREPLLR